MSNLIAPVTSSAADLLRAGHVSSAGGSAAQQLLNATRQMGVPNMSLLAIELGGLAMRDPKRAADLLAEIKPQLSIADRQILTRELAETVDTALARQVEQQAAAQAAARSAPSAAAQKRELALDLVQIGLSVAGIFDPTPVSDGLDGLISLFRGDFLGAGISAVSMVPYIGDAAKLGKLGKFAETIARAVDLAKADAAFARTIRPALENIRKAIDAVPIDSLPGAARNALQSMQAKLDEFAAIGTRSADEVAAVATRTVSRNGYDYTLDSQQRVLRVEGTLQLDKSAPRSPSAQRRAGGDDRLGDDQGGHYIARIFRGPTDDFNHFAQNGNFNMGAYRSLERQWDELLHNGHRVRVDIVPRYTGDSLRPDLLRLQYWVDGVPQDPITFRNVRGGR